ncbi:biosynthetic arginine decarboxylase [Marinomonas mediterranea]|jgi:arginine decarboxylase (EC 4.1.1.19)|uniref:Arginine decarboxylase n=1 Tax=Marinomonas mediterranea (strain ATCC 700492 / JCM 21426 / NBRC 103028 / MMB-1) TaxID=717774 RepID=F2JY15_MARM1|nr:biosynthetic arginine decarboxylase [Marinomonas mediterranea]ADZ90751.1 arginine decarboxylase [Marinomonas mediterranea MMB-1]WCN12838.1 biosynthetic arginine decarboxylase [Marinomonas mediterranea]WCN16906.1 biosynthetic arginine decarboxylase [Marinomonas mediterranea MMB-1]
MKQWSVKDSIELYNVDHWSGGFFSINDKGCVTALPNKKQQVDLTELAKALKEQNVSYPCLVRFPDILHSRIERITQSFCDAIDHYQYKADYAIVYPIKVNQQRRVVEEITSCRPDNASKVGLEAGSKPELMAVLAMHQSADGIIVCNGYKDKEFIHLALMAEKMGHQVFLVVEKFHELEWIIEEAKRLDVSPRIGIRIRLASTCSTHWGNSGGEKSKFGLTTSQLLRSVQLLKNQNMVHCLELIHFHLGSQITRIRDIQNSLKECARYYSELHLMGVNIQWVDVGGGLGVDYEGTRSQSAYSANYSISEYANNVVFAFHNICEQYNLPHPHIISESGRAVTAHHAMIIADVFSHGVEHLPISKPASDSESELQRLWESYEALKNEVSDKRSLVEIYHDLADDFNDSLTLYNLGQLTLEQRGLAENVFLSACRLLLPRLNSRNRAHRPVIDDLNERLAEKLFVNVSVFQSMPDAWGIDQVFPVLPLQGLDMAPSFRGKIQDVTCDSDGCLYRYVDGEGLESSLPLPPPPKDEDYLMGFFMVGAYQETLGDLHNLFGDTCSVDVYLSEDSFKVEHVLHGDSVQDVLTYVSYNDKELFKRYEEKIAQSLLEEGEKEALFNTYKKVLKGTTYLK